MALVKPEKRFKQERAECLEAWQLLRKIPEYIADYKKASRIPLSYADKQKTIATSLSPKASTKNKELAKELEEKWGFFPLENPENDLPNFEFICRFSNYSAEVDRFKKIVDFNGLDLFNRRSDGLLEDPSEHIASKDLPLNEIAINIDLTASDSVIMHELKEGLAYIRKTFGISPKNRASHDSRHFICNTLMKAGLSEKRIKSLLASGSYDCPTRQADWKKTHRRLKKISPKVST